MGDTPGCPIPAKAILHVTAPTSNTKTKYTIITNSAIIWITTHTNYSILIIKWPGQNINFTTQTQSS